jgi:hypothetical protein
VARALVEVERVHRRDGPDEREERERPGVEAPVHRAIGDEEHARREPGDEQGEEDGHHRAEEEERNEEDRGDEPGQRAPSVVRRRLPRPDPSRGAPGHPEALAGSLHRAQRGFEVLLEAARAGQRPRLGVEHEPHDGVVPRGRQEAIDRLRRPFFRWARGEGEDGLLGFGERQTRTRPRGPSAGDAPHAAEGALDLVDALLRDLVCRADEDDLALRRRSEERANTVERRHRRARDQELRRWRLVRAELREQTERSDERKGRQRDEDEIAPPLRPLRHGPAPA